MYWLDIKSFNIFWIYHAQRKTPFKTRRIIFHFVSDAISCPLDVFFLDIQDFIALWFHYEYERILIKNGLFSFILCPILFYSCENFQVLEAFWCVICICWISKVLGFYEFIMHRKRLWLKQGQLLFHFVSDAISFIWQLSMSRVMIGSVKCFLWMSKILWFYEFIMNMKGHEFKRIQYASISARLYFILLVTFEVTR